jgi:hypothetical protein
MNADMRFLICLFFLALAGAHAKSLKLADLPEPVRKAVEGQTIGAQIKNIIRERDQGKTYYEVESIRNGKARDFLVDATGSLVEVEEEIDLASLPAAARVTIEKQAVGGVITREGSLTKGSSVTTYEATVTKRRKKSEIAVTDSGAPVKENYR